MSNPSIKQLGSDIIITPNVDNMQTRAINLPSVDPVPVKVFFFLFVRLKLLSAEHNLSCSCGLLTSFEKYVFLPKE